MDRSLPFVSIVLPVFNEQKYLQSCLATLRQISYPKDRYEVITVDNGSTDDSFNIAQQYADLALQLPDVNVGAVRNYGVKHAKGSVLVFLDSDCLVPQNWLELGVALLAADSRSVYGGNLYLREHPAWIEKYWLLQESDGNVSQKDLLGSCIFIYRDDFLSCGGFDEQLTSGEDSALSQQLKASGFSVVIDKSIGVVHLGNPTTVGDFIKRQMWHSENYVKAIGASLKDKVFWLVLVYLSGIAGLVMTVAGLHLPIAAVAMALLLPPAILSAKRIVRAKFKPLTPVALACIFFVDSFYLLGRSLGTLKGLVGTLTPAAR